MYKTSVTDEIKDILLRSEITETTVKLPPEHLDRKVYQQVDTVLRAAGGKWDKRTRVHIFSSDPREALSVALDAGKIQDKRKAANQFFTPPDLAARLCDLAGIGGNYRQRVLEPSAGKGSIADIARERGAHVVCVEKDPQLARGLEEKGHFTICSDFLDLWVGQQEVFDCVVMNPPFTKRQDVKHVEHAMKFMKQGGKLVAIMSAGQTKYDGEMLPEGTFKSAGTMVRAKIVVLTNE